MEDNVVWRQVVREKVFRRLRDELPYGMRFGASQVDTLTDGSLRIELPLLVGDMRVRPTLPRSTMQDPLRTHM